ncbi:hypothetical protein BDR06DRAFT_969491 [Suillus hirtellus]|nr:hypothetical protein BDR06DRAFT_969491 [Suillus hirtellus]
MSKCGASSDDAPTVKCARIDEDEWKEAQHALFSGDGNDNVASENLHIVKAKHIPQAPYAHKVCSAMDRQLSQLTNPYLDLYAGEDDDDKEEKEEKEDQEEDLNDEGKGDNDHTQKIMCLPGSSLATSCSSFVSFVRKDVPPSWNVTDYVAKHLQKNNFHITVSAWIAGQLYVLADSPKTISDSLSFSLYLAVKQYVHILDEECAVVEQSHRKFPNPVWVRIQHGKYKGDIAQVFNSNLPNDSVAFLCVGNRARIVKGDLSSEIGQIVSTDHLAGSVTLELILSGCQKEIDVQLEDIEHIFQVSDTVQVVAGPYLSVEGYIIQMMNDIFHLCQDVSKEEIGDSIDALMGKHMGKSGVMCWLSKGGNYLWF